MNEPLEQIWKHRASFDGQQLNVAKFNCRIKVELL